MIYYFASDDIGDITPDEDWTAFTYFICIGEAVEGTEGLKVSLSFGDAAWTPLRDEGNLKLVPKGMPYDIQQDFMRAIWNT